MATRYIPLFLKHSPTPRVENFSLLSGLEAAVRGTLISAMPLAVYDALGSAEATSAIYFIAGLVSLTWGLFVPWGTRFIPRRWMYTLGCGLYILGLSLGILGTTWSLPLALMTLAMATATTFVCLNAYVLDYIDRGNLGRSQSMQMVFAAGPWAVGPLFGVWLRHLWAPLPFIVAACFVVALLSVFWILRLGNGKQITRAKGPATNPLAYLGRFFAQPRLIAGWSFAVIRSCGWWVYVVYLPIFCIEAGLGDKIGGVALSLSNALLFTTPLMLRVVNRLSVRRAVQGAFGLCSLAFFGSALLAPVPIASVLMMMGASVMLVALDVAGGLPFLMAVKPSERTEMAAIYSSFRDVSGILTPGAAWLVLLVAPLPGVFAVCGAALAGAYVIAGRLHPRLGAARPSHGRLAPGE